MPTSECFRNAFINKIISSTEEVVSRLSSSSECQKIVYIYKKTNLVISLYAYEINVFRITNVAHYIALLLLEKFFLQLVNFKTIFDNGNEVHAIKLKITSKREEEKAEKLLIMVD